jgi:hypothetical protein
VTDQTQQRRYPWRLFFLLVVGALLSVLAVLPYLNALLEPVLAAHPRPLPLPLPVLALIQATINFSVTTGLGLLAARQLGLGAPILESWLYGSREQRAGNSPRRHRPILLVACSTGILTAVVVVAVAAGPAGAALRHLAPVERALPLWKRFLACFYGGLGEEVLMRLFLLSVVLWIVVKIFRAGPRNRLLFWITNVLVAIAFGAGHLPVAASLGVLTPTLVITIISLNAFVGLGFGYLYWSRGLEAAMVAHFSADIILHVVGPTIVK